MFGKRLVKLDEWVMKKDGRTGWNLNLALLSPWLLTCAQTLPLSRRFYDLGVPLDRNWKIWLGDPSWGPECCGLILNTET